MSTPHPERPSPAKGRIKHRLVNAAEELYLDPDPTDRQRAWAAVQLVKATLPHREPPGNPPVWYRRNGNFTLIVKPGYCQDHKTGKVACMGYPFGTIPRLLLYWIATEVVHTQSRQLILGTSLSDFMRELGLNPDNGSQGSKRGDARRLRQQIERLFRANISFDFGVSNDNDKWLNMDVTSRGDLWFSDNSIDQNNLWTSWIELGEKFYEAIIASRMPIDLRALRALKNSSLALDTYTFLVYRTWGVNERGAPSSITWKQLEEQLGSNYGNTKSFKRYFKEALHKIKALYSSRLRVKEVEGGIVISPGSQLIENRA